MSQNERDFSATYRRYLSAVVLFHLATADVVGLSGTDYQASSLLDVDGPMTSGELAARLGLTTGAATRAIDRLVASGHARRTSDAGDRRRVLVEHTGFLPEKLREILDLVREPIAATLTSLTDDERAGVLRYLTASTTAYADAARHLRDPE